MDGYTAKTYRNSSGSFYTSGGNALRNSDRVSDAYGGFGGGGSASYYNPGGSAWPFAGGGGGYSGMLKGMLVALGWDTDKIYVVGGYWYYDGENDLKIKQDDGSYAFWKIPYHNIDFTKLTEIKND